MRKKAGIFILSYAITVLVCAGIPCLSFGAGHGFRVFRVEIDSTDGNNVRSKPVTDFYINGGQDDGLKKTTVLDVYREKIFPGTDKEQEFKLGIYVGRIQVFKLFKKVAITRLISLTPVDDDPVLQYRTVMKGDVAFPRKNDDDTKQEMKNSRKRDILGSSAVSIPSNILFDFDQWTLKPEAVTALSTVYDLHSRLKDKDILIEGHTCSLGPDEYNMELSRKRAQSVSDYLMYAKGVLADRIHIEYYGEELPVASNDIEEGRVMNRRVDIRFLPGDMASALSKKY